MPNERYEYLLLYNPDIDAFDQVDRDGWELVSVIYVNEGFTKAYFKKRL